jgi:hypothetical protein
MVCREFERMDGQRLVRDLDRGLGLAQLVQAHIYHAPYKNGFRLDYFGSGRHIVMPLILRNADNVGIV